MRKQQREITVHQRDQNNAINDAKQISLSHVIVILNHLIQALLYK